MTRKFIERLPGIIDTLANEGWVVVDDFLAPNEVQALLADGITRRKQGDFHRAGVGREQGLTVRDEIRGDSVLWLDPQSQTSAEAIYWEHIAQLQAALNQALYLGIREGEFHYAHYPVGSFYKRHLDRFRDDDARIVSAICYLNTDWQPEDGGQLRIWLGKEMDAPTVDVLPQAGRLALFLSDRFWHEVLPAQRERWSVTGWLRRAA